ncbi:nitroreductase [Aeromicrobium sp. Leaf350]|uniref:nitroreductase n=1 Tax=Aeromicrobium sp. Leaf350 TaxID=2876565 RepID=UPI001E393635|nr:nitroreductase [Aeromicrobium sp. Leaf350]
MTTSELDALRTLLTRRHSVRGFRPDAVPSEVIEAVWTTASRTPSWCNTQPWEVVVTSGDATQRLRRTLSAAFVDGTPNPDLEFPTAYHGIYRGRRLESALQLYGAVGVERGDRAASAAQAGKNFSFFGAPHVAVITTETELGVYGAVDCGLFLSNALLAFEAQGVGAIPQAALATYSDIIREHLGIPDTRQVVVCVSFGWEETDDPANQFRTARAEPSSFVTYAT